MKHILITTLIILFSQPIFAQPDLSTKYKKIQKYIDQSTEVLAGISFYINHPKYDEWSTASGLQNVGSNIKLQTDNIISLASIGKMYVAVACMKLYEEGRLSLDDYITKYLTADLIEIIPNAEDVQIKHLLGHTTGFYNYETDPVLNEAYLSGNLKLDTLTHINALNRYFKGKPVKFSVGDRYNYSSTNYLLLALIMDTITGDHTFYIREHLIEKYGLKNTFYRENPTRNNVKYYADLDNDELSEDVSEMVFETTNWFKGDDGIYSTAEDCGKFLTRLMKGEILQPQTLELMQTWNDQKSPDYGYGLMADKSFPYKMLIGHSGSGIGVRADAYYFPAQDITIVIVSTSGLRGSSKKYRKAYYKMRTKIVKKLFLF